MCHESDPQPSTSEMENEVRTVLWLICVRRGSNQVDTCFELSARLLVHIINPLVSLQFRVRIWVPI